MSVRLVDAVFCRVRGISPTARFVLVYLAHRTHEVTGECFPSEVRIAEDTGYHLRTVRKLLGQLKAAGLVSVSIRKTRAGDGRSYAICIPGGAVDNSANGGVAPPLNGGVGSINRGRTVHQMGAYSASNGGVAPPDSKEIEKDSVCDRGHTHTSDFAYSAKKVAVPPSADGVPSYDVGGAARRLADDGVPEAYIENRAMTLESDGGFLPNGQLVTVETFQAHCRSWWKNERDKDKWLPQKVTNAGTDDPNHSAVSPCIYARDGECKSPSCNCPELRDHCGVSPKGGM